MTTPGRADCALPDSPTCCGDGRSSLGAGGAIWPALAATAVLAALIGAFAAGWLERPAPGSSRWMLAAWFIALVVTAAALPARRLRAAALGVGVALIVLTSGPAGLLGCGVLLACALAIGLRMLGTPNGSAGFETSALHSLLAGTLGCAVISFLVGLAVWLPINSSLTHAVAAAALLYSGRRELGHAATSAWQWAGQPSTAHGVARFLERACVALAWLILLLAALPEVGHDALSMHLAIPQIVAEQGHWPFDVTRFVWAVMPMNANWLHTAAFLLGGEAAIRLFNTATLLLTAALIAVWGRKRAGNWPALFAAALWLSLPLALLEAATVFVELPLTLFSVAALVATERAAQSQRMSDWIAAGALFGAAVATKLPALLLAPGLALVWLATRYSLRARHRAAAAGRTALVAPLTGAVVAALLAAPPYVTAWLKTGNPAFPFFNSLFKSPLFDATASFTNPLFVYPLIPSIWIDLSLHSSRFLESPADGALGLAFLALIPVASVAAIARRDGWVLCLLAVALSFCVLVFREQVYLRYILPVLPLLCIVCGYALGLGPWRRLSIGLALLLLSANVVRMTVAWWGFDGFRLAVLMHPTEREKFIRAKQAEQSAAAVVRALAAGTNEGLAIFELTPVVARGPANVVSDSWHSNSFVRALQSHGPQGLGGELARRAIRWVLVPTSTRTPAGGGARELSILVAKIGEVEIRQIDLATMAAGLRELLSDPDLIEPRSTWGADPAAIRRDGPGVIVTAGRPLTQGIAVRASEGIILEHRYACDKRTAVRSQVNWYDASNRFLTTTIEVFACDGEATLRRFVVVPAGATTAIVYAVPHGPEPAIVTRVSAKGATR